MKLCVDISQNCITVETVIVLSYKKAGTHININVEFGDEKGQIPIDEIARKAEELNLTKR